MLVACNIEFTCRPVRSHVPAVLQNQATVQRLRSGGQVQRLVMMTPGDGGVDSHCQIPQRPKLFQSQASLQTSAQAYLLQDPPSGGRPVSVSDFFSSRSPCNSAPPKDLSNAGRGFHLSAAKAVSFEGLSGRLFECERRQRLKRCSPSVCATKWDGKRNPRNIGQTQPRALLISVSQSSPKDSLRKCFCRHPQVGHHNNHISEF